MKRIVFVCALVGMIGVSNLAFSQAQVAIGLKGGLNLAKFDLSAGTSNIENRTGFHGGAFGLIKISKIGIQPEIIFSKQGSNFQVNTADVEANFDYINVPILLKLYLVAGLNLQAGPQFGFLSTSEIKTTVGSVTTTEDVKSLLDRKSDTSIAVGAGWDLPFGLTLDARYNIGLSDVKLSPSASSPIDIKNKVIQISVGYKLIKLGK